MTDLLTLDDLKKKMPKKKNILTQEAVDIINASLNDPEFQGESLLKTAINYESVLAGKGVSVVEYLNAIRFCAYIGEDEATYIEAYKKVFQDRDFVKNRWNAKSGSLGYSELGSAASRYRRSKVVVDILTISQVPLDLMFTGYRYRALGALAQMIETTKYDRDRINACKELLAATKGAENINMKLDVGVQESSAVSQLQDQLQQMAAKQKLLLETGTTSLQELGAMKVQEAIEGEVVEG